MRLRTVSTEARARAERTPDALCVIDEDERIGFARLVADADSLAASLHELGLRAGDTVSFQLPNWHEAMVIDLAADLLGCIVNPIVPIYRGAEMEHILADAGAAIVFVPESFRGHRHADMVEAMRVRLPKLRQVVAVRGTGNGGYAALIASGRGRPLPAAAPAPFKLVMYTSGTTGPAKGVLHTHASLGFAARGSAVAWGIGEGTRVLAASPITHIASFLHGLEMPFFLGSVSVMLAQWNAAQACRLISAESVEFIGGATPFLQDLVHAVETGGQDLGSLRVFSCGGAAVPPALIRRAQQRLPKLRASRSYGMTEAPWITRGFHGDGEIDLAAETDGRVSGYAVRIVDEEGRNCGEGMEGEILARGPALFSRYTIESANAAAFDAQGFFRTGDLGVRQSDALTVTGRKKDLIIRGGENLSPKEVEDVLHRHPSIVEAAVVGAPHPRLGETVFAYVIGRPGSELSLAQIAVHCASSNLATQKTPEGLEIVADLPRTASGKVRKDLLRKALAAGSDGRSVRN